MIITKMVDPMALVHPYELHGKGLVVYDDEGKIVIMTRNKKIALSYLPNGEAASQIHNCAIVRQRIFQ